MSSTEVDFCSLHPNLVISQSRAYPRLITKLRDVSTSSEDFVRFANRALRLLVEDALAEFPTVDMTVSTPCGDCSGVKSSLLVDRKAQGDVGGGGVCAVSIMRSGDAVVEAVRSVEPCVSVGKILIQRDEGHPEKLANLMYVKLPPSIIHDHVLLCDPMLATGGSARKALDVLVNDNAIPPQRIILATLICAPEGLQHLAECYPLVKIVTVRIDSYLNAEKFIVPGLGDFGDRFYNTM